jgi:hypothetical protein
MNNKKILLVLFVLALAGLACQSSVLGVPLSISTPAHVPSVSAQPISATPFQSPAPASLRQDAAGRADVVCFQGIESGTLRVRECPGLECGEAGVLASGDQITAIGERRDVDGATWLRITSPVEGWVNARYVCEISGDDAGGE